MKLRQLLILALIPLALGACRRRAPAVVPGTDTEVTDVSARERARADSIAAFEAAERERQARLRSGEMARAREVLTDIVYFEYDSFELGMDAQDRLREKAEILRANPGIRLRIEGHADERGSTEYNLALGQRRAEAVRTFLGGYGIGADRLATISYGKERPLVEGSGEAAWARNRRAEFAVTAGEISIAPPEGR